MTKITFFRRLDGLLCGFKICGHAGFAGYGKDIVCAAVSSAVYLVVNTVIDVMRVKPQDLFFSDDSVVFLLSDSDANVYSFLLRGLFMHFVAISKEYPKNLLIDSAQIA